jgi:hypothetical protein
VPLHREVQRGRASRRSAGRFVEELLAVAPPARLVFSLVETQIRSSLPSSGPMLGEQRTLAAVDEIPGFTAIGVVSFESNEPVRRYQRRSRRGPIACRPAVAWLSAGGFYRVEKRDRDEAAKKRDEPVLR